jgi:glutamyl-tRNA(Gln) amidotransferase subunit E
MTSDPADAPSGPRPPLDLNPRRDPPLDFPDRDLGELSPADYATLGFIAGLEVHQQLATRGKLFCRCPAGRRVTDVHAEVLRHMRPTLSELGEYDGTALMEFKTRKEIVYLLERNTVCTYEMDDTPPFPMDDEAVRVALEIALVLGLDLVSELHVMRKQYLDGSIPTGFQRTAMVALSGAIPFRVPALGIDRALRIRQFSLEEDSCREVSDVGHRIVFRTDRLGMPLIETVTEPDLRTPFEVEACGRLLARAARATGKVRRGEGAARQDTNVSVAGGRRIEIKGVSMHRLLPILTHVEAFRQLNLLRLRAELLRRGVRHDMLQVPDKGVPWKQTPLAVEAGGLLRRCEYMPVRDALERGDALAAVRLPGFGGLLARRTQPGITFAREFADRVRVIACLTAKPFMIHSDVRDYGLSPAEWKALRGALRADSGDTLVVLWGPEDDVATAVREVAARAREALDGVPSETRQPYPDGTNGFERILPGPDRMYPDTDTPPKPIPDAWVAEITAALPERPWDREARWAALGLEPALAARLAAVESAADLFDALAPAAPIARRVAVEALRRPARWMRRRGIDPREAAGRLAPVVGAFARGAFRAEALGAEMDRALLGARGDAGDGTPARAAGAPADAAAIEARVREAAAACAPLARRPRESVLRHGMGIAMRGLLGRADPREVRARLERALEGAAAGASR